MSLLKYFEHYLNDPRKQYWALQCLAWFWYLVIILITITLTSGRDLSIGFSHAVLESLVGLLITHVLATLYRATVQINWVLRAFVVGLSGFCAATAWTLYKWLSFNLMFKGQWLWPSLPQFGDWFSFSFAVTLAWIAVYFSARHYWLLMKEKQRVLALSAASKEAQVKMLRYQLNPHFLKNTLNAISTLILKKENINALEMLDKLSAFLDHTLYMDPMELVTVEDEFSALQEFVDIESVRFQDRLHFNLHLEDEARFALMPSLLLQPIVENAIKYGVNCQEQGGSVEVSAVILAAEEGQASRLQLLVQDNGPGLSLEEQRNQEGRGIGIRNTVERLKTHYDQQFSIDFESLQPQGLKVVMHLPLNYED